MVTTKLILLPISIKVDEFAAFLKTLPGHDKWFYNKPHAIFVNTSLTPDELASHIEKKYGEISYFIAPVEYETSTGRMPDDHWKLIKKRFDY